MSDSKYARARRRAEGKCLCCGKPLDEKNGDTKVCCAECARKNAEKARQRRERQRNSPICLGCGKPKEIGVAWCPECRKKENERLRKYGEVRRQNKKIQKAEELVNGDTVRIVVKGKHYEGEEKYADVDPTDEDLAGIGGDARANVDRCLSCEIPVQYCTGENCVRAYRMWKYIEELKGKKDGG